jgi:protein transport protein SEC61 subunit beta
MSGAGMPAGAGTRPSASGRPAGAVRRRPGAGAGGEGEGAQGGQGGGGGQGGAATAQRETLRFYTDDAPGLMIGPTMVLVLSLLFVGSVVLLHIAGKIA